MVHLNEKARISPLEVRMFEILPLEIKELSVSDPSGDRVPCEEDIDVVVGKDTPFHRRNGEEFPLEGGVGVDPVGGIDEELIPSRGEFVSADDILGGISVGAVKMIR